MSDTPERHLDFIRTIVDEDLKSGKHASVATRFPPEPNGYLHIGHAKSICLNFGIAREFGGTCNLRFDDTNPSKEEQEYVDAIQADVQWLGFSWDDRLYFASDYFEKLYEFAELLIKKGLAYVDDQTAEQIRENRGTLTQPGLDSPWRDRHADENLDLFRRMRAGEFPDGSRVLRAKIDMASPNVVMRDPTLYRIRHAHHHRTGDAWCIYPMYDFTHCLSDALEHITHSICTLEFENNRELYDWVIDNLPVPSRPRQYEFARLNLAYVVVSKRRLIQLVTEGHVTGWDDPRMPTLQGLRRRGYTPEAIRLFAQRIGVARAANTVEYEMLEACLREDLNDRAPRAMAVLNPVKLVVENYPEGQEEIFTCPNHPEKTELGERAVPFCRELYIDRDDFRQEPPKGYHRLSPGKEVRLRHAYYVTCTSVETDPATGEVTEIRCAYDPATKGGWSQDGRKVKGTIHWVSARHAAWAEVRLYDRLFTKADPMDVEEGKDFLDNVNRDSLQVLRNVPVEPALTGMKPEQFVQFERVGYFVADRREHGPDRLVFNRSVGLRDSWAKQEKKAG
ncbi:Glutamine--tRNA ligase [Fundidesulfovibrio magnetotacticus]|uniref:Glutamine--tRNA ligase n=1 Tax=Fundidesulfovibrio magnetotacticus TaxID=2730080 RepID=A0A6V8LUD6_9BACT|nr:glutamine--tRNA ligase/YqeY domain fusion protein [Fundidesulfovibrio magnetotacticus]GFK95344.1 Glutamine--tRNA ligase [Fundidesulfovibrio magnetotacticus]